MGHMDFEESLKRKSAKGGKLNKISPLTKFVCALCEEFSIVSEGEHAWLAEARVDPTRGGRGHEGDGGGGKHQGQGH